MFGLPNLERKVSDFLEGGNGITAIRNVEWDKNFLWTVEFVGGGASYAPPEPFTKWFPASEVALGVATLTSFEQQMGQSSFKFPQRTNALDISITFYDNEDRTLLKWIKDWINLDILNNGQFMSGIADNHKIVTGTDSFGKPRSVHPSRHLRLALLDAFKKTTKVFDYVVVPDGDLSFAGGQNSSATEYTVNFIIVENLNIKVKSESPSGKVFDEVKKLIGRFV